MNGGYFDAACGENHSLLLTDQLEILSCGSNTYGQLGIGQTPISGAPFQQIQNSPFQQVAQTTIFRLKNFVTADCQSVVTSDQYRGEQLPAFQQVVCGSEHSFALSKDGELFSWGLNFKGQLGLGDFENRYEPTLVEGLLPLDSQIANGQNKKNLISVIKRSKSKEAASSSSNNGGGISQRNQAEEMKFSQTMNI